MYNIMVDEQQTISLHQLLFSKGEIGILEVRIVYLYYRKLYTDGFGTNNSSFHLIVGHDQRQSKF